MISDASSCVVVSHHVLQNDRQQSLPAEGLQQPHSNMQLKHPENHAEHWPNQEHAVPTGYQTRHTGTSGQTPANAALHKPVSKRDQQTSERPGLFTTAPVPVRTATAEDSERPSDE